LNKNPKYGVLRKCRGTHQTHKIMKILINSAMKTLSLSLFLGLTLTFYACGQNSKMKQKTEVKSDAKTKEEALTCDKLPPIEKTRGMNFEVQKTDEEWKKILTEEEYKILRLKSTERAFTGKFNKNKEKGTYICAACESPLFKSEAKFDSGTGWPSYYNIIGKSVATETDTSYGMTRTEVMCAKCGGHLGHLFEDGPQPTGLRYCINSASMKFVKSDK
jgi:peptide-methionine (R)-S-oxide reductase